VCPHSTLRSPHHLCICICITKPLGLPPFPLHMHASCKLQVATAYTAIFGRWHTQRLDSPSMCPISDLLRRFLYVHSCSVILTLQTCSGQWFVTRWEHDLIRDKIRILTWVLRNEKELNLWVCVITIWNNQRRKKNHYQSPIRKEKKHRKWNWKVNTINL
jgi:hypothetical protein